MDMKTLSEDIKSGLSAFLDGQLRVEVDGDSCHVAYPSLMPDGWQVTFTVRKDSGASDSYVMTDYGHTMAHVRGAAATGFAVNKIINEKCAAFGMSLECDELRKVSIHPPSPTEMALFAEGMQAVAFLSYRGEPSGPKHNSAMLGFASIIRDNGFKKRPDRRIVSEVAGVIHFDAVVESSYPVACKVVDRSNDLNAYMAQWTFLSLEAKKTDDRLRVAMIYNPSTCRWNDRSMRIAESRWDLFASHKDGEAISKFLKNPVKNIAA